MSPLLLPRLAAFLDSRRYWVLLVLGLLYLASFNGQWRVESDSALYLSLGRNLAEGRGYTYQGQPNEMIYPGLPYLLSACYGAAGFSAESSGSLAVAHFLANGLMLGFALAALALIHRWANFVLGRPFGLFVTVGCGLTFLFYRYAFQLMTEMPFMAAAAATLAGYEGVFRRSASSFTIKDVVNISPKLRPWVQRWPDALLLVGGLVGMALLRPTAWALLPPVLVCAAAQSARLLTGKRRYAAMLTVLIGAVVIGGGIVLMDPFSGEMGSYESFVLARAKSDTLVSVAWANTVHFFQPLFAEAIFGLELYSVGNVIFTVGLLLGAVWLGLSGEERGGRVMWAMWVVATLAMMLLILPVDRYLLPILPILVLAWVRLMLLVSATLPTHVANVAVLLMLLLGSGSNFGKTIGHTAEQHSRPFLAHYKNGRYAPPVEASEMIAKHVPEGAWVLTPFKTDRIISYYSRRNNHPTNPAAGPPPAAGHTGELYLLLDPSDAMQKRYLEVYGLPTEFEGEPVAEMPRKNKPAWKLYLLKGK